MDSVACAIEGPPQAVEQVATEEDLRACYRLLLGRQADPGGWQGYLPYVRSHATPVDELVGFFLNSVEFRRRLTSTFGWSEGAPVPVDLTEGYRIWLRRDDPNMATVIEERCYEPEVVEIMKPLLGPGAVVVDVGASFGYYTVLAARLVGPKGRVLAIEPGPQNLSVLLLNLLENGLANVEVVPAALGRAEGVVVYSRSGANGAISPYEGDPSVLATNDLVRMRRLDDLVGDLERLDLVKIDTEGAEGLVLAGAREALERHRPVLFFELSPHSLTATSGVEAADLLGELASMGYGFEVIGGGRPSGAAWSSKEVLDHFGACGRGHLDLVARADRAR